MEIYRLNFECPNLKFGAQHPVLRSMSTPSYPSGQSGRWYRADILVLLRTEERWTCLICRDAYGRIIFWMGKIFQPTNLDCQRAFFHPFGGVKSPFYQLYHIDCWINSVQFISINRTSIPYTSINCSIEDPGARLADVHDAAARGERPLGYLPYEWGTMIKWGLRQQTKGFSNHTWWDNQQKGSKKGI